MGDRGLWRRVRREVDWFNVAVFLVVFALLTAGQMVAALAWTGGVVFGVVTTMSSWEGRSDG